MTTSHGTIDKNIIHDRIKAAMLGYAIGDALGKGTEFMTTEEARHYYPDGLRHYDQIIRDAHRSLWRKNQWTADTELILLTIDALSKDKGYNEQTHAAKLKEWFENAPEDAAPLLRWILSNPQYLDNPKAVSAEVWQHMDPLEASNEALGRCLVLSLVPSDYTDTVINGCRLTHHDSRCISSAMVIAKVAHDLLWHGKTPSRDELEEVAKNSDERTLPYIDIAFDKQISDFNLDHPEKYWYTRFAMGSALWTLNHCQSMEDALHKVIMQAGDANTNAALALALFGLRDGSKALPESLRNELHDKEKIKESAARFADSLIEMAENGIE